MLNANSWHCYRMAIDKRRKRREKKQILIKDRRLDLWYRAAQGKHCQWQPPSKWKKLCGTSPIFIPQQEHGGDPKNRSSRPGKRTQWASQYHWGAANTGGRGRNATTKRSSVLSSSGEGWGRSDPSLPVHHGGRAEFRKKTEVMKYAKPPHLDNKEKNI